MRLLIISVTALLTVTTTASSQMHGGGGMHDEVNMPMLYSDKATTQESEDLKALFIDHKKLRRRVELLPNGIKTLTETDDDTLRDALLNHAVGMMDRVFQNDSPEIPIQSPTLDPIFEGGETILTEVDITETGIIVIQTSDDPQVVAALHIHAQEVSDLVDRGMMAVHEQMMKRHHDGSNHGH